MDLEVRRTRFHGCWLACVGGGLGLLGGELGWYAAFAWFDDLAHGLTSFALALALGAHVSGTLARSPSTPGALRALVVAAVLCVGAAWEVFEWTHDRLFASTMVHGTADTVRDLVADAVGAVVGTWAGMRPLKGRQSGRPSTAERLIDALGPRNAPQRALAHASAPARTLQTGSRAQSRRRTAHASASADARRSHADENQDRSEPGRRGRASEHRGHQS
ncbi:MAG TPA: hypothetical protein VKY73_01315 [Polyangiaceae bacterium]|nr:hypothetical protein [Polyangiaceae bacterium]